MLLIAMKKTWCSGFKTGLLVAIIVVFGCRDNVCGQEYDSGDLDYPRSSDSRPSHLPLDPQEDPRYMQPGGVSILVEDFEQSIESDHPHMGHDDSHDDTMTPWRRPSDFDMHSHHLDDQRDQHEVGMDLECGEHARFGCCPKRPAQEMSFPAHGPYGLGCCSATEFGCCPDNRTPAQGHYDEGCLCRQSRFGCCLDGRTPARGPHGQGCGCESTDYGCCPDGLTPRPSSGDEGCPCESMPHGCCHDGITAAQGQGLEGCPECGDSELGCCGDRVWPQRMGCGCAHEPFGCCLDNVTAATGPFLQGCPTLPAGTECFQPAQTGHCTDYVPKWFFDKSYGGCGRFWYGGCQPGPNHFDDRQSCEDTCVTPRDSAACFLPHNAGPCKGAYNEWAFDITTKRCIPFVYGGCLGNDNRFKNEHDCKRKCLSSDAARPKPTSYNVSPCDLPKAEGPCKLDIPAWYYDAQEARCIPFSYSGCMGNANRFADLNTCSNVCQHKAQRKRTEMICSLPIAGIEADNDTLASLQHAATMRTIWSHDVRRGRCVPLYLPHSKSWDPATDNIFESLEVCEKICPPVRPPELVLPAGSEVLLQRGSPSGRLPVLVLARPPATVQWFRPGGEAVSKDDVNLNVHTDGSLELLKVSDNQAGQYRIQAFNGIGQGPVEATITAIVYPVRASASIKALYTYFTPGSTVSLSCTVRGYPPPAVKWFKQQQPSTRRQEAVWIDVQNLEGAYVHNTMVSTLEQNSVLHFQQVTPQHSGTYTCVAGDPAFLWSSTATPDDELDDPFSVGHASDQISFGVGHSSSVSASCQDRASYRHCPKVVMHRLCSHAYHGRLCCRSCLQAGFLPSSLQP